MMIDSAHRISLNSSTHLTDASRRVNHMRGSTIDPDGLPVMSDSIKPRPAFKVWLETDEGFVFGPGVDRLLRKVEETGTLKEAAESLGMSYRFAWGLVRKAEEKIGQPLIIAHKGGRAGGGGAELTEVGHQFLDEFSKIEAIVSQLSRYGWSLDELTTRNRLEGSVKEVEMAGDKAEITLKLQEPVLLRLTVPKELITERKITAGSRLTVEVNSMVGSMKVRKPNTP